MTRHFEVMDTRAEPATTGPGAGERRTTTDGDDRPMHLTGRLTPLFRFVPPLLAVGLLLSAALPAAAQPLAEDAYKTGSRTLAAFRPVVADARKATVRVYVDGEPAALGVVVSEDGFVLSKATQLRGEMTVRMPDGREAAARTIGIDGSSDLALLKVDATGLTPAEWADDEPAVGSWLASVGDRSSPVGVGVVSVAGRRINPQRGVLGIELGEAAVGAAVVQVFPGSGAAEAGLEVGDVITAVAGTTVANPQSLVTRLKEFRPGDTLPLVVRRGEKEEEVKATLGNEQTAMLDRQARQNMMGGPVSVRSGGFDVALQHDTVLRPEDCGGPVVDLSGRVVGVNIARAGRVESYALPAAAVRPILARLMASESRTAQN